MPIRILCTTSKTAGAKANKPVNDPAKALGLAIIADPRNAGVHPTAADLPVPAAEFANVTWVQLIGFKMEITDYGFLSGFPALTEIRFERGNVSLDGIPEQITALVVKEAALQRLDRSSRFHGFEAVRIAPITSSDADAIAEHPMLRRLSVTQSLDPQIDAENWARLTRLTSLFAASVPFRSLEFLRGMTALTDLQVMNLGMTSLDAIAGRPLERLLWTELSCVQNYRGLERFTALKELSLYQQIPDLALLSGMEAMEVLKLTAARGDLSVLARMPRLREVELSVPPGVDLSPLAGLAHLSKLMLSFNDGSNGIYLKTRKAIRAQFGT